MTASAGATTVGEHVSWVSDALRLVRLRLVVLVRVHVHTV